MAETRLVSPTYGETTLVVRTINGEMQTIFSQGAGMEVQAGITIDNADDVLALITAGVNAVKFDKSIDELHIAFGALGVWEPTDSGYGNFTSLWGSGVNSTGRFDEGDSFEVHESELTKYEGEMPKKEKASGKKRGSQEAQEAFAFRD